VAVPFAAILYSGEHRYVFVDHGGGNLEPREVHVGQRADEYYVVLSGLEAGERVVTSGNFLISSEAQLKSALPKWEGEAPAPAGAPSPHQHQSHGGHGQ
ncbi:MAG: efflux RND transporter periplasmic adaptor subunit, partial [Chrysiogenetes bacterium]|nr:efflux RND transporter periplasmic adaptor subunit [Chrysiogenetes bacterium]